MLRLFLGIFFIYSLIFAQGHKFVWLMNPEITNEQNSEYIEKIIDDINNDKESDFVIITGNITKTGKTAELNIAHEKLNQINKKIYIIPGYNDTKYSVDGGMIFRERWEDDRFSFAVDSTLYIGFSTSVYYNSNQSHVPVETLSWLKEELSEAGIGRNIVLFTNNTISDKTDNYASLINILSPYNISLVLNDRGSFRKYSEENGINHYTGIPVQYSEKKNGGYSLIENSDKNISIVTRIIDKKNKTERTIDTSVKPEIKKIDEPEFENISTLFLWKKDLAYTQLAEPIVYNKRIFIADRSGLVSAFNNKGKTLWEYDVFGDVVSRPTAKDGLLAVATTQGDLNTIEIKSGESIQTIGFDAALTAPLLIINYTGSKPRMIPKNTKSNSAVIVSTDIGKIYCLDLETLEELWVNEDAKDAVTSQPIFVDNKIIFTSHDQNLYCIDAREGWLLWKWKPTTKSDYSIASSKLVADSKNVFLPATNGNVYAVDIKLGKQNWVSKNRKAWETISISKDSKKLYVKSTKDNLHVLSSSNGKTIKTVIMKYGHDRLSANLFPDNKVVFVPCENGLLYRINDKYNYKTIIKMLPAPLHSVIPVSDNEYIISDYDGKIIYFKF